MKLLFWDIDGTLMRTDRAGLYAFEQAIADLFGKSIDFRSLTTAGMTDCYISEQIIAMAQGRPAQPQEVRTLIKHYEEVLPAHLAARQGQLMPNVKLLLDYFYNHDNFISVLLTGNTSTGAKAKLARYEILPYFDFSISAFGDDCPDRLGLAVDALAKAHKRYPDVDPQDIFIIGDTPNDIRCGKSIGANTIAVATGAYTLNTLLSHSPWWAVSTLPLPAEFEAKLLSV